MARVKIDRRARKVGLPSARDDRSEREVRQKIRGLIRDQEQGIQPAGRLKLAAYLQDQWLGAKRRKLGNGALRYEEFIRLHHVP